MQIRFEVTQSSCDFWSCWQHLENFAYFQNSSSPGSGQDPHSHTLVSTFSISLSSSISSSSHLSSMISSSVSSSMGSSLNIDHYKTSENKKVNHNHQYGSNKMCSSKKGSLAAILENLKKKIYLYCKTQPYIN